MMILLMKNIKLLTETYFVWKLLAFAMTWVSITKLPFTQGDRITCLYVFIYLSTTAAYPMGHTCPGPLPAVLGLF